MSAVITHRSRPKNPGAILPVYLLAFLAVGVFTWTRFYVQPFHVPPSPTAPTSHILLPITTKPIPKVALLFLTRGPMPLENIWRWFLGKDFGDAPWQHYFSIYTHPVPGYVYPTSSLFAGHEVKDKERVEVKWGQHSMVEAERVLLRTALKDPRNQHFILLSEDAIPLYRPAMTYLQLVSEHKSRINVCANPNDPRDVGRRQDHRWQAPFAEYNLTKELWRKDSQWTALTRRHAEIVVEESQLNAVFAKECWADRTDAKFVRRFCVSDEHYIPSLFAVLGLEKECACNGVATHVLWEGNYFHPKTYGKDQATEDVFRKELRGERCRIPSGKIEGRASEVLGAVVEEWREGGAATDMRQLIRKSITMMPPQCPLFARKIDAKSAEAYSTLLAMLTE